jgi:hypothetical protein
MAADTAAGQTELADFGILGPLEVSGAGVRCHGRSRQRAVLALLRQPNRSCRWTG